jgi:hypothetical protein
MWGLHEYADATGSEWARDAAERTSELFLEHRLYRRLDTGEPMPSTGGAVHRASRSP